MFDGVLFGSLKVGELREGTENSEAETPTARKR
jgi:hypothetical protein